MPILLLLKQEDTIIPLKQIFSLRTKYDRHEVQLLDDIYVTIGKFASFGFIGLKLDYVK